MSHWTIFWACVVGVLSVARTARLLVWDAFPPTMWLRMKWDAKTERTTWNKLLHCQFCATPYMAAVMFAWAVWSGLGFHDFWGQVWWIANGVWGLSYVSAIVVAFDQDD